MRLYCLAVMCLLIGTTVVASAQLETGQITGVVTDKTGALIVGAQVTAVSKNTGTTRTAISNSSGSYTIPSLSPDSYEVSAESKGFAKLAKTVQVTVGSHSTVDFTLQVSGEAVTTTIEVTVGEAGVQVNTESQELSQVVSQELVQNLPNFNRNPYDFVALSGNVNVDPGGNNFGFSLNGQRSSSMDALLDGAQNVNIFGAGYGNQTPLDSVQEFRVITNNFSAEYGRATGGIVNVVTKSGSNAIHGSLYEFNRASALAANTFDNNALGVAKPRFVRNQFGYSVGGPVKKDKLFYFSSTEWTRVRSQASNRVNIFDPALVSGSQVAAATSNYFNAFGQLRPGTQLLKQYRVSDLSTSPDLATVGSGSFVNTLPGNPVIFDLINYRYNGDTGVGVPQDAWNSNNRVDFNLSDKTTMYFRYAYNHESVAAGGVFSSPYTGYDQGQEFYNHGGLITVTHIFTPSLLQTTKVAMNRLGENDPLGARGVMPELTLSSQGNTLGNNTLVFPGQGYGAGFFGGPQNFFEFDHDVSWTKGKHQFKFGGQYVYEQDNRTFGAYQTGEEYGYRKANNSKGLDNILQGRVTRFRVAIFPQGLQPCVQNPDGSTSSVDANGNSCTINLPAATPSFSRSDRFKDGALYAQDSWKVNNRLTLNGGIRWEYFGVQHNNNPNLESNFYLGSGSNIFQQIRSGQVKTTPNSPSDIGGIWAPVKSNFAPRVGAAWDVFGDGKTSLRGGYGLAYERNYGNVTFNVIQNPPNNATIDIRYGSGQDFPGSTPLTTNNFGPFAGTGPIKFKSPQLRAIDPHIKTAYSHLYSASLERQVARNTVVAVEYSGSKLVNAYSISNINEPGSGVVYLGSDPNLNSNDKLNRSYGNINFRTNGGFGTYNAMNLRLESSNLMNLGLQIKANYTWSHSIDNLSQVFSGETAANGLGFLDPFNPKLDKGDSDYDARQRLVLSSDWNIPWFKKAANPVVKHLLGGWELTTIWKAQTGNPFTAYDCTNQFVYNCPRFVPNGAVGSLSPNPSSTAMSPNTYSYLVLPTPNSYAETLTGNGELPTCSQTAAGFSTGQNCVFPANMFGRNNLRQPGFYNINLGVYKNIAITERYHLQLRSEFFNMLNHSNLYLGGNAFADASSLTPVDPNNPTGPTIVSANRGGKGSGGDRRIIQLALRLTF